MHLKSKQLTETIARAEQFRQSIGAESLLESHFIYAVLSNDASLMSMISRRLGITADVIAKAIKDGHYVGDPYSTDLEERAADAFLEQRPTQALRETHVFLLHCRERKFAAMLRYLGINAEEYVKECYCLTGRGEMLSKSTNKGTGIGPDGENGTGLINGDQGGWRG